MSKTANLDIRSVSPSNAKVMIQHCMKKKRPVFVWGAPGIGKSEIVEQIAEEEGRLVIDMRLLLMGPEDLKGIPYYNPEEGTMMWAPSNELPAIVTQEMVDDQAEIVENYRINLMALRNIAIVDSDYDEAQQEAKAALAARLAEANEYYAELQGGDRIMMIDELTTKYNNAKGRYTRLHGSLLFQNAILFLDEMNSGAQTVQGAAYQLILNRRIGEYKLPENVRIIAAGNRETDKGVTYAMPKPLANRFTHLHLEVKFDDWQVWAINNGVGSEVVGFLTHNPHHLYDFDPKSSDKAFATPRTWVFVDELIDDTLSHELNTTLVAGTIGEGLAISFMNHRKVAADMPKPQDVLDGLEKKLDVKDISARYSLTVSMCYLLKEYESQIEDDQYPDMTNEAFHVKFDNFLDFLMRNMGDEMVILGSRTAMKTYDIDFDHELLETFDEFYEKYGCLVLDN